MLRTRLQEVTDNADIQDHQHLIELIRIDSQHSVKVVPSDLDLLDYNCYAYALKLSHDDVYQAIRTSIADRMHADTDYVSYLLEQGLLRPINEGDAQPEDVIIYFQNSRPRHAGVLTRTDKILSKWGTGNLYEHPLWEVPESYGSEVKYYADINENASLRMFVAYAADRRSRWRPILDELNDMNDSNGI